MKKKTTNYTMNLSADESQKNTWDFAVAQEELKTSGGVSSGIHAVIRQDTGEVIGQYRGVKVLPYTDMVQTFEAGLNDAGFTFTRSLFVTGNGARFFGRYEVGSAKVGNEDFKSVLRLQSSHDGSLQAGFSFEAERLACLNGMMLLQTLFAMFKKHSTKLDLQFLAGNIQKAIDSGLNHLQSTIDAMLAVELTDEQVRLILSNIVALGASRGVSPRAGYVIYDNWLNPSADETNLGNNLYRLYNNATRFTRDLAKLGRFEMSRRANLYLTGAMDLAARNTINLDKLLAPVTLLDFDGVTVNQ
jgi:hypothetical protein